MGKTMSMGLHGRKEQDLGKLRRADSTEGTRSLDLCQKMEQQLKILEVLVVACSPANGSIISQHLNITN